MRLAQQPVRGHLDVVEEQGELLLGHRDLDRYLGPGESGRVRRARRTATSLRPARRFVGAGPGDDEDGLGLVDAGDVVLRAPQHPGVPVGRRGRGDPVRVRPRVGLGDAERHEQLAGGEAGEPPLPLGVVAEAGDDRGADRGGHREQEQRAAAGCELLADDRELADAHAAATERLGDGDAEVAVRPQLGPQLVRAAPGAAPGRRSTRGRSPPRVPARRRAASRARRVHESPSGPPTRAGACARGPVVRGPGPGPRRPAGERPVREHTVQSVGVQPRLVRDDGRDRTDRRVHDGQRLRVVEPGVRAAELLDPELEVLALAAAHAAAVVGRQVALLLHVHRDDRAVLDREPHVVVDEPRQRDRRVDLGVGWDRGGDQRSRRRAVRVVTSSRMVTRSACLLAKWR